MSTSVTTIINTTFDLFHIQLRKFNLSKNYSSVKLFCKYALGNKAYIILEERKRRDDDKIQKFSKE